MWAGNGNGEGPPPSEAGQLESTEYLFIPLKPRTGFSSHEVAHHLCSHVGTTLREVPLRAVRDRAGQVTTPLTASKWLNYGRCSLTSSQYARRRIELRLCFETHPPSPLILFSCWMRMLLSSHNMFKTSQETKNKNKIKTCIRFLSFSPLYKFHIFGTKYKIQDAKGY